LQALATRYQGTPLSRCLFDAGGSTKSESGQVEAELDADDDVPESALSAGSTPTAECSESKPITSHTSTSTACVPSSDATAVLASDFECDVECSEGVETSGHRRRRDFHYLSVKRIQQHQASCLSPQLVLFLEEPPRRAAQCYVHAEHDYGCLVSTSERFGAPRGGIGPMRGHSDLVCKRHGRFVRPIQVSTQPWMPYDHTRTISGSCFSPLPATDIERALRAWYCWRDRMPPLNSATLEGAINFAIDHMARPLTLGEKMSRYFCTF